MSETSETPLTGETTPDQTEPRGDDGSELQKIAEPTFDAEEYQDELRFERRAKVYRLRLIEKKPFSEIAKILGVSEGTVYVDFRWVQKYRMAQLVEQDKALLIKQDETYQALLDKWLPVALREDTLIEIEGHMVIDERPLGATDRVIKVLAEQAKLHGFGQPGKTITPKEIGAAAGEHVLQVMQKLAEGKYSGKVIKGEVIEGEAVKIETPSLGNGEAS